MATPGGELIPVPKRKLEGCGVDVVTMWGATVTDVGIAAGTPAYVGIPPALPSHPKVAVWSGRALMLPSTEPADIDPWKTGAVPRSAVFMGPGKVVAAWMPGDAPIATG